MRDVEWLVLAAGVRMPKTTRFAYTLLGSVLTGLLESSTEGLRHCVRIAV